MGMRFSFGKSRKTSGWLAIHLQRDGICVSHVQRTGDGKPAVHLALFTALEKPADQQALDKLSKELRLDRYQCTTLLGAGDYQLLSVDAPIVQPDELKTAVRWRVKDMIDYSIDDATIDVLDIPVDKNAASRNHSMYAVAARTGTVADRQTLLTEAKIPLSVIDIPEMAQRNISALLETEGRGVAMLSFDNDGGLLTVTFNGELYLSRRIDVPMSQLVQTNIDQRTSCYDRITLELQRSLDHFDRQYHFIAISRLFIAPLGEGRTGLQEYLASNMYMPVEALDLETALDISRVPDLKAEEAQQRYFMSLGAALREEAKTS